MRKLFRTLMLVCMCCCFTSCITPTSVVSDELYATTSVSYSVGNISTTYEIVWIGEWPYWYTGRTYIPYHHTRPVPKHHFHHVYRQHRPVLHNGRFHPSYQVFPNKIVQRPIKRPHVVPGGNRRPSNVSRPSNQPNVDKPKARPSRRQPARSSSKQYQKERGTRR